MLSPADGGVLVAADGSPGEKRRTGACGRIDTDQ
jgi:hypothetical protein